MNVIFGMNPGTVDRALQATNMQFGEETVMCLNPDVLADIAAQHRLILAEPCDVPVDAMLAAMTVHQYKDGAFNTVTIRATRPCPGCGDPNGDCPGQACVQDDC